MPVNLSVRHLQTFREVMRSGSVTAAARVLGRTQPAVSAMIASLEVELGFTLFKREKGRLVPRPEAHYFLEEADAVLDRLTVSARVMREVGNLERGRLRIACMPAASAYLLPTLVAEFVRDRPAVSVSLMMRSSRVVEDWIASQQYDIGVAETPAPREAITLRTFDMECVCAVPAASPLAAHPMLTPADLDGYPMAALYPDHATYRGTRTVFEAAGARLHTRFELQTFLPAFELVGAGLAACVCDPVSAASHVLAGRRPAPVVFRPFRPSVPFSLAILTPAHRPQSGLVTAFVTVLAARIASFSAAALSEPPADAGTLPPGR